MGSWIWGNQLDSKDKLRQTHFFKLFIFFIWVCLFVFWNRVEMSMQVVCLKAPQGMVE